MTGRARVNRVWGVIDRTTNNLLGEFPTREEADEFFNELLAADHRAGLHVEVVEAKGHATGSRAAKIDWRSDETFARRWGKTWNAEGRAMAEDAVQAYQRGLLESMLVVFQVRTPMDKKAGKAFQAALDDVADIVIFGDRGVTGTGEGGGDLDGAPPPEPRCDGLDTGCTGTPDCPVHMGSS